MIDFTGFSQGFGERRKEDRRLRREMAQAFQEFRNQNPYATAQEFQDFIDRYSGGRNYIAGGAPSKDVLQSIAAANQERKARDEMARRMEELRTRAQTMSSFEAMADDFLLGYDGDDFDKAQQDFLESIGMADAPLPAGINPGSLITKRRRDELAARRAREFLPQAMDLVRSSDGKIDASALRNAYPDLPPAVINPVIEQAQSEYEREQEANARALEDRVSRYKTDITSLIQQDTRFQSALRTGNERLARRILRDRISILPQDIQPEFTDDWIDNTIQGETALLREVQRTEIAETRSEAQAAATQARQNYDEENIGRVSNYFGSPGEPYPNTGPASGAAVLAAQQLAREFDMNRAALFTLERTFAQADEDMSTQELYNLGRSALANAAQGGVVQTVRQGRDQAASAAMRASGFTGPQRSFDDYLSSSLESVDNKWNEFETALNQAVQIEDPDQRRQRLQAIRMAWNQAMSAALQAANQDAQNADTWLEVGSGGWDNARITGDGPDTLRGRLLAYQQRLEERIAEVASATPPPNRPAGVRDGQAPGPRRATLPPPEEDTGPSTEQSRAGVMVDDLSERARESLDLTMARGEIRKAAGLADPLVNRWVTDNFVVPEAEGERREGMREFTSQVLDPLSYLLRYNPDEYGEQLLRDLASMSREEFERKYQSDIEYAARILRAEPSQDDQ